MSVYKRKRDGKYVAQLYDREAKKHIHIGVFDKRRDAVEAEGAAYNRRPRKSSTLGEFAARWTIDFPRPALSTNRHNARQVSHFVAEYENLRLNMVTIEMARAWCLQHQTQLPALRAMFNDAKRHGYVTSNPFADMRLKQSRGRKDLPSEWLTVADIDRLVNTARLLHPGEGGEMAGSIIQFAAYTGLRPGEIWELTHDCVSGGELEVRGAFRSSTSEHAPTKTKRTGIIPIIPQAKEAIDRAPNLSDDWMFTGLNGQQLRNSSWHNIWNPIRCVAGLPNITFYEMRHFCATFMLELGLSPADVAHMLRHSDGGALVMSTYGHPSERAARNRILNAAQIAADGDHGKVRAIGQTE